MLTVLAIIIVSTLTAVAMFDARFTNTGGNVFARVQETRIHTVPAEITWGIERERKRVCLNVVSSFCTPLYKYCKSF